MNKSEIIKHLETFPYDRREFWVITGAAMVLYGIKEETADIDLGCSSRMADELEKAGYFYKYTESGNRWFRCGEHIEIFENWLKDTVTEVEGFSTITLKGMVEMKWELGREKDMRDIALIEEFMEDLQANEL